MKNLFIFVLIAGSIIVAIVAWREATEPSDLPQDVVPEKPAANDGEQNDDFQTNNEYRDELVGFKFLYPKNMQVYGHTKDGFVHSQDASFVTGFQLIDATELAALEDTTIPREGPATVQIKVYENRTNLSPLAWTEAFPVESNSNLTLSEPTLTNVGGAEAVRYITDGLYAADTYVVTQGEYVILLRAEYVDESSDTLLALETIKNTFTFGE